MSETSTSELIQKVRHGQVDAYEQIVLRFQDEVWRVAAALLRDRGVTESLVQQAFVEAYFQLDRFDAEREFGPWIKAIARNLVRKELRGQNRENRKLSLYREHLLARLDEDREAKSHEEELTRALSLCRGQLAPKAARLLELRYDKALSFEALAGMLGRSAEATRRQLCRIRLALRECIEKTRMAQA